ncbi:prepilin-type N-terminal cleavage/methylation domain-containing protein [Gluconobacter albidus]|uniref:prepilin-type N-terminal cleavage/methylation domain-containing protein n=1 Tax=Gluconobacter albidus TaxID=318683 RepID=UPI0030A6287D
MKLGLGSDSGEDGFTLLEILVVTVVFGLLSVALWQGVGVGTRGWSQAERRYGDEATFQGAEEALRRLIERAETPDGRGASLFSGDAERLGFVSWLPEQGGYGKQMQVAFGVDAGKRLVLRWRRFRRADCTLQPEIPHEETLARDVGRVEFSYYGVVEGHYVWQKTWESRGLPLLVRIRMERIDGGALWPAILVRPLLAAPAGE